MTAERMPWAALRQTVLFWLAYLAVLYAFAALKSMVPASMQDALWGTTCALVILAITLLLQRRHPSAGGGVTLRRKLFTFVAGVATGLATYALILLVIHACIAPLHISIGTAPPAAAILWILLGIAALAAMEELGFRGFPLRTLTAGLGFWPAQILVALAFAGCHLLFGWTWTAVMFGVLPSALLFGMAAATSNGLSLPIGLHAGLNAALWAFGEKQSAGFWRLSVPPGSEAHTGQWAPAAGILVTLAVALLLYLVAKRRPERAP